MAFEDLEGEIWKPIKDRPGYEISNMKRVRTYKDRYSFKKDAYMDEPRLMSPQTHRQGYKYVGLTNGDGKQHKGYIHHLYGEAFIDNPDNKPEINHENGIKDDNDGKNLTWMTHAENMAHAWRTGLIDREKMRTATIEACHREVYCYEDDRSFYTAAEAAKHYGVSKSAITLCCQGKIHCLKDRHFCYIEDIDYLRRNIDNIRAIEKQKKRVKATNVVTGEERIYPSRREASKDLKIPDSYISNIIAGRSYQTRGWTFADMPVQLEERR